MRRRPAAPSFGGFHLGRAAFVLGALPVVLVDRAHPGQRRPDRAGDEIGSVVGHDQRGQTEKPAADGVERIGDDGAGHLAVALGTGTGVGGAIADEDGDLLGRALVAAQGDERLFGVDGIVEETEDREPRCVRAVTRVLSNFGRLHHRPRSQTGRNQTHYIWRGSFAPVVPTRSVTAVSRPEPPRPPRSALSGSCSRLRRTSWTST